MNALLSMQSSVTNCIRSGFRFSVRQLVAAPTIPWASPKYRSRSLFTSASLFAKKRTSKGLETIAPSESNLIAQLQAELAHVREMRRLAEARIAAILAPPKPEQMYGPNPTFRFPIVAGENGPEWFRAQEDKWGTNPPFIDRSSALFSMLCNAYRSTCSSDKPVVTLATTSIGFGKTRILVEWIGQVFLHPHIVGSFLADKSEVDASIKTDVETQLRDAVNSTENGPKQRANFLLRLYNTAKSASIITIDAENSSTNQIIGPSDSTVLSTQVELICRRILSDAIASRFPHENISTLSTLKELFNQYIKLTMQSTKWPDFITHIRPEPLLIINIDEVQAIVEHQAGNERKNLTFEIATEFLYKLNRDSVVVNMAGLYAGKMSAFIDQSKFYLVPYLPMDPLLKREYLEEVCEKVLHKKLYSPEASGSLNQKVSSQLHELWITACGIPRSIETLVAKLRKMPLHHDLEELTELQMEDVHNELANNRSFEDIKEYLGPKLTTSQWNKLLLDFVFCTPKRPDHDIVPGVCYENLEGPGLIMPFHFVTPSVSASFVDMNPRNYTIPFHLYSQEIQQEVAAFQGKFKYIPGNPFKSVPITLEKVLRVYGHSVIDPIGVPANEHKATINAGKILVETAAASLWLRYLHASDLKRNKLVPMNKILSDLDFPATLHASWKGVIYLESNHLAYHTKEETDKKTLERDPEFYDYVDFLAENHLIAINPASSQFADVIAPLYDQDENFSKLLCIQCHNTKQSTSPTLPTDIFEQLERVLENNDMFMLLAPNTETEKLSLQAKSCNTSLTADQISTLEQWEDDKEVIVTDGKNFLSDWFLQVFADSFLGNAKSTKVKLFN